MHDKLMTLAREVLGEYVTYCRLDEIGQERTGGGHVCSIHMDERRRVMVRILDGGKALNIDAAAINLSEPERSAYFEAARSVRARTDAINHNLNVRREKGEAEIDAMQDKYLGLAITLAPVPEEPKEEEKAA